jgi:hypothetical protein
MVPLLGSNGAERDQWEEPDSEGRLEEPNSQLPVFSFEDDEEKWGDATTRAIDTVREKLTV